MISDNGLRDAKTSHYMVKEELSNSDTVSIICGHHLGPFSKIVDDDDDIAIVMLLTCKMIPEYRICEEKIPRT